MKVKEYLGKLCKITIDRNGKELFYEATINGVSDIHISFKDKYGEQYTFKKEDVVEISEAKW